MDAQALKMRSAMSPEDCCKKSIATQFQFRRSTRLSFPTLPAHQPVEFHQNENSAEKLKYDRITSISYVPDRTPQTADALIGLSPVPSVHLCLSTKSGVAYSSMPDDGLPAYGATAPSRPAQRTPQTLPLLDHILRVSNRNTASP